MKISRMLFVVVLVALLASACGGGASQAAKYPERDITLVIQASAGGGSDLFARTFANTVTNKKLLPVVVVPDNRPGASGAVAFAYVNEQAGDPYYMLNASGQFITTPILGEGEDAGKVTYKNFTPIAALATDEFFVAVKGDSKFATLQDVVDAAKAEKDSVIAGGTGAGAPDSIAFYMIEKATGANFNYVVFDGGEEVNAALLGRNVDVAIGNLGDFVDLYKAGDVRLLGSFSEERLAASPEVPTLKEQGIDAVYKLTRGFVFPSGVPQEAVTAMEKVIAEYMKTDEWKEYLTTNSLTENYMNAADFAKFLEESTKFHTEILTEMGVIGQ